MYNQKKHTLTFLNKFTIIIQLDSFSLSSMSLYCRHFDEENSLSCTHDTSNPLLYLGLDQ